MTYLKSIYVYNCYASQNFDIDFSPKAGESFRHLIVTGKNGSGKTTLLNALDNALMEKSGTNELEPKVDVMLTDNNGWCLKDFLKDGLYDYFKIERDNTVLKVKGPKKIDWTDLAVQEPLSQLIVQFLVNKKTEQAYAYQDGDQNTVQQIEQWFNQFEQQLKFLFDEVALRLEFSRQEFNFYLQLPEQAHFDFNQLSHGYAQVISIIAEILIAIESSFSDNPSGIILIDEIENHLHLELQEKILPFLTTTFPKLQFIVATHSPAVIASINNATVYDLSTHRTVNEILTGIPYHVLMKSHFCIESEYSRVATEKLKRAKELIQKGEKRTEADDKKLQQLAQELDELSPDLSLDIFLELERQRHQ
jgi:predicted ATP-binding protein involved in virulence